MKHVISYSGGIGSFVAATRVFEKQPKEDVYLLFTDTLTEDEDLYRFLVETALYLYGKEDAELIAFAAATPLLERDEEGRKKHLKELGERVQKAMPNFIWLSNGNTVWEVFEKERLLGNSMYDPCSKILKRNMSNAYIKKFLDPGETIIYLGIDWTEEHRYTRAKPKFLPFVAEAPLCEEPLIFKHEMFLLLDDLKIELPRLYKMGFSHNNCGGFCVKAGLGHFRNLNKQMPERYKYHEEKEQDIRKLLERKDIGFLKKTEKGKKNIISMEELRVLDDNKLTVDELNDIGGCGCFVDE